MVSSSVVQALPRDRRASCAATRWRTGCTSVSGRFPPAQRQRQKGACKMRAPLFALSIASAIALLVVPPVRAQAIPDPQRSPDVAFVAKASDATTVDAE